ncbi:MAG: hypothetical protein LV479_12265, partial [Methylacidiphilales bacterium]|nr:hypothetical protein [Candidatus Methylacidiphilales bacterium]
MVFSPRAIEYQPLATAASPRATEYCPIVVVLGALENVPTRSALKAGTHKNWGVEVEVSVLLNVTELFNGAVD